MQDDKQPDFGGKGGFAIDESLVYLVRKKADGLYKIFQDGRPDEKIEPSKAEKEK